MDRSEQKRMRVEISMLHRTANQLQDMPDPASKIKARALQLEAEMLRDILRRVK